MKDMVGSQGVVVRDLSSRLGLHMTRNDIRQDPVGVSVTCHNHQYLRHGTAYQCAENNPGVSKF